jgi:hypothetical protein
VLWRNQIAGVDASICEYEPNRGARNEARAPGEWAKGHEFGMRNRSNDKRGGFGLQGKHPSQRI